MADKLRYGIIGAGGNGKGHIQTLRKFFATEVEIVALADIDPVNLKSGLELAGDGVQGFEDYRALLDIKNIDAVVISTFNNCHAEIALAAFEAGKHVLCEKPMATTVADCNAMIATSKKTAKLLQVGLQLRYAPTYRKMHELIAAGEIGAVQLMWCEEFRGPLLCEWRYSQEISGGALVEKNCHHFDLFNWMISAKPVKVCAFGGQNLLKENFEIRLKKEPWKAVIAKSEIIDNALVIVDYDNEARGLLSMVLFSEFAGGLRIGAMGEGGKLENYGGKLVARVRGKAEPRECMIELPAGAEQQGSVAQHRAFIDSIREGTPVLVDGEVGKASVLVPIAAERSIQEGRIVFIDELLNF